MPRMLLSILLLLPLLPRVSALADDTGSIRIKADAGEAEVFLDGKGVGKSPLTLTGVTPGAHQVTLTRPGYEDHEQQVQVAPGATAKVFVMMKALRAELPKFPVQYYALHQHAAGACNGILTVTAEALDYKSSDGKDVFHIPIDDIKSLSRSMGTAWWTSSPLSTPGEYAGCRLEIPGRSLGFFAYEQDPGAPAGPIENRAKFRQAEKTKELFELVYRLWMDSLPRRQKTAAK
ncbi:MAG TPA: PEGA domain-containing protein [Terriglobales bacterium]|nr:PEGA domain-containing protein [Terriglobales bacterium]